MPRLSIPPMDRDRAILLGGSAAITAVAWFYLIRMSGTMRASGGGIHHVMDLEALFVMWAVMMVAMMLPAALPFVFAFRAEQARRKRQQLDVTPPVMFIAGYFVVWIAFSLACAVLQQWLHGRGLLSPAMSAASSVFAGAILIAAGVYQWTPMKGACLRHCRSPLTFLLSDWRGGWSGAFRMGAGHGLFCVGCCWMLMMLPFAAGVMSLAWMAGITVLLLLEKAAPGGEWTARISGALLGLAGTLVMVFRLAL